MRRMRCSPKLVTSVSSLTTNTRCVFARCDDGVPVVRVERAQVDHLDVDAAARRGARRRPRMASRTRRPHADHGHVLAGRSVLALPMGTNSVLVSGHSALPLRAVAEGRVDHLREQLLVAGLAGDELVGAARLVRMQRLGLEEHDRVRIDDGRQHEPVRVERVRGHHDLPPGQWVAVASNECEW
jgi:hypothetical protein